MPGLHEEPKKLTTPQNASDSQVIQKPEASRESKQPTRAYLNMDVQIAPGEVTTTPARAPNFQRDVRASVEFRPYKITYADIEPNEETKMINETDFLVTIINKSKSPFKLQKGTPIGTIKNGEKLTTTHTPKHKPRITVNLVDDTRGEEEKPRVIIVGDYQMHGAADEVKKTLTPFAKVETFCSAGAEMNEVLDNLNHITPEKNRKTILVIVAGNRDFDRQYCLLNHSAITNNMPLGRIRELVQSYHVAYATILPRYDVTRLNDKIGLVNADMVGQLIPGKNLTNIRLNSENLPKTAFNNNGRDLNEKGNKLLTAIITDHVKKIINDQLELGIVSAIENGTRKKLNLKRPLRIKGVVNFKETSLMLC
nr:PREDICTED: uncharacterized protein LOC109035217 [Bemisia tabaci]